MKQKVCLMMKFEAEVEVKNKHTAASKLKNIIALKIPKNSKYGAYNINIKEWWCDGSEVKDEQK